MPEIVKETDEKDFMKILDWLDVWIILLDTNGKLCTLEARLGVPKPR